MTGSGVQRSDFAAIANWIKPEARVLDLGCADGSLLRYLAEQRGSIGYIDMQRLFKTFPETSRAKESFEELVRQAEEQLNLRKAEILRMRSELAQLKARHAEVKAGLSPAEQARAGDLEAVKIGRAHV